MLIIDSIFEGIYVLFLIQIIQNFKKEKLQKTKIECQEKDASIADLKVWKSGELTIELGSSLKILHICGIKHLKNCSALQI